MFAALTALLLIFLVIPILVWWAMLALAAGLVIEFTVAAMWGDWGEPVEKDGKVSFRPTLPPWARWPVWIVRIFFVSFPVLAALGILLGVVNVLGG